MREKTGIIVACRMKSSRLPGKALLRIGGETSIRMCLDSCLKVKGVKTILATSWLIGDEDLLWHLPDSVYITCGEPENLFSRYIQACFEHGITTIVRLSGDCPVVFPEIAEILIDSHFETGADYTQACRFACGTTVQVWSLESMAYIASIFPKPKYHEHMSQYWVNNYDIFKINQVNLPGWLVRDYRLTLDYPEDLKAFRELFSVLERKRLSPTTENILKVLDDNPEIAAINSLCRNVYEEPAFLLEMQKNTRIKRIQGITL
jgi:N,N'-diacetyllegionaminate synthase